MQREGPGRRTVLTLSGRRVSSWREFVGGGGAQPALCQGLGGAVPFVTASDYARSHRQMAMSR